ncbi:hypothetical protein COM36_10870 [Bacillus toyonensis]|nr:hypothetical protein [Bacillus toyonensis]MBE7165582.1 hypothetical protein [Bacillus toyonensis]PGD85250.1 hypothetical protein COM36_10870 [Bacillus toyonensis]
MVITKTIKSQQNFLLAFYCFLKIVYQVIHYKKHDMIKFLGNDWNVLSYLRLFCKIKLVSCEQK